MKTMNLTTLIDRDQLYDLRFISCNDLKLTASQLLFDFIHVYEFQPLYSESGKHIHTSSVLIIAAKQIVQTT